MKYISIFMILLILSCSSPTQYDLIIRNGRIIDGTGNPEYVGDIAINADTIAAVGDIGKELKES
jgi:N-acyl-D-amino-acid deacylase